MLFLIRLKIKCVHFSLPVLECHGGERRSVDVPPPSAGGRGRRTGGSSRCSVSPTPCRLEHWNGRELSYLSACTKNTNGKTGKLIVN